MQAESRRDGADLAIPSLPQNGPMTTPFHVKFSTATAAQPEDLSESQWFLPFYSGTIERRVEIA